MVEDTSGEWGLVMDVEERARRLLSHPYVLRCAWEKTRSWMSHPWQRTDRDWAPWAVNPDRKLAELAEEFRKNAVINCPKPWVLIPFPKETGEIRHHVQVPTHDEVAFMAYAVLLAPLLERRMWPTSFGNRWYRGMARLPPLPGEDPNGPWQFRDLPYQLSDTQAFQSYGRSHGLFRRVAHWTALRMLDAARPPSESAGPTLTDEDFPKASLPFVNLPDGQFVTSTALDGRSPRIFTARLDLRKAYPSVKRAQLEEALIEMLSEDGQDADGRLARARGRSSSAAQRDADGDFSDPIWTTLEGDPGLRIQLAKDLMKSLNAVKGEEGGAVESPAEDPGLYTGLGVSSLLFNVYLHGLDAKLAHFVGLSAGNDLVNGAWFRYVDDIVLMAPTQGRLAALLDVVFSWLHEENGKKNLDLNPVKTRPAGLKKLLEGTCAAIATSKVNARRPEPKRWLGSFAVLTPAGALDETVVGARLKASGLESVGAHDADNLGEFVTTVVEQLSELGRPTLHDLFGHETGRRLVTLHRLIRLDLNDGEVRTDTRMAFSARRIATAPEPVGHETHGGCTEQGAEKVPPSLAEIGFSIRMALLKAPSKFALWDAVFLYSARVAALRCVPAEWIAEMAGLVRQGGDFETTAWNRLTPSGDCVETKQDFPKQRFLATTFHRANLLHSFASVVRSLDHAAYRDDVVLRDEWLPTHWAYPLMTRSQAKVAVERLLGLREDLLRNLYGTSQPSDLTPWELEAKRDLDLASLSPAEAWNHRHHTPLNWLWRRCRPNRVQMAGVLRSASYIDPYFDAELFGISGHLTDDSVGNMLEYFAGQLDYFRDLVDGVENCDYLYGDLDHIFYGMMMYDGLRLLCLRFAGGHQLRRRSDVVSKAYISLLRFYEVFWSEPDVTSVSIQSSLAVSGLKEHNLLSKKLRSTDWVRAPTFPSRNRPVEDIEEEGSLGDFARLPHAFQLSCVAFLRVQFPDGSQKENQRGAHCWELARKCSEVVRHFGGEQVLDSLFREIPRGGKLTYRLRLREAVPLPEEFWLRFDALLDSVFQAKQLSAPAFELGVAPGVSEYDYIDVDLGRTGAPAFMGDQQILSQAGFGGLDASISVRIGQIDQDHDFTKTVEEWPSPPGGLDVLRSLTAAIPLPPLGAPRGPLPPLTLLPEVSLPPGAETLLRTTCERYGLAVLIGRYWTPADNLVPSARPTTRWFTNDALLAIPLDPLRRKGHVHVYTIRKPIPAVAEFGLAKALTAKSTNGVTWRFLRGTRIYRFIHPKWGNFSVGICSDLLDAGVWAQLNDEKFNVQHLFLVSHNKDVELYHVMTRTRAYELLANVVLCNHGTYGGSYAWTPKSGVGKEVARFNGAGLRVVSDVVLPVRALAEHQENGRDKVLKAATEEWLTPRAAAEDRFKPLPPRFRKTFKGYE